MISASEIRDAVNIPVENDDLVFILRDYIIDLWESITNCKWSYREGEVFTITSPYPVTQLSIPIVNVISITKVEEKDYGEEYEEKLAGSFDSNDRTLVRLNGAYWKNLVRVTCTGGYTSATCPVDIRRALLIQVKFSNERHAKENLITRSKILEAGTAFYEDADIHPHFKAIAARRRKLV